VEAGQIQQARIDGCNRDPDAHPTVEAAFGTPMGGFQNLAMVLPQNSSIA
jgi:hypothetical protein